MSIEKYVMNVQERGTGENHRKMVNKAAEIFLGYDLDAIAKKVDIKTDENYLYIDMLTRRYRISRKDGSIVWSEDGFVHCIEAGFSEAMTIYDLIAYSKEGAKASGEYTQIKNLADTLTGSYYAGKSMIDSTAFDFDGKEKALARACESLGGVPYGRGDVSYKIPLWRDLYTVISFWSADEEFPPQLVIMLDMNMKDFIHYETMWYLEGHLMNLIKSRL